MKLEFEDPYYPDGGWGPPTKFKCEEKTFFPSCSLCRFDFDEYDSVIVFDKGGEPWASFYKNSMARYSASNTCHGSCVSYATPSLITNGRLDPGIAATTDRGFAWDDPPEPYGHRRRWLEDSCARNIFHTLLGRLPQDICDKIAGYCVQEWAVQVFRKHWLRDGRPNPAYISVPVHKETTVWAQYVHFEGIEYIRSLSYKPRGRDDQILFTRKNGLPLNIFIAHDHLGVQDVFATTGEQTFETDQIPGLWWTMFTQRSGPFYLKGRFDVSVVALVIESSLANIFGNQSIKIRDLGVVQGATDFLEFDCSGPCEIRWAIPPAPRKHSPKVLLEGGESSFIQVVHWNMPDTVGYSFLVFNEVVETIIPHKAGNSGFYDGFYPGHSRFNTWLYFPMDPDERVSEFWVRTRTTPRLNKVVLILLTNKGRSLVLGPEASEPDLAYHAIAALPQDRPCSMFYTRGCNGSWLHFDSVFSWDHPEKRRIRPALRSLPDVMCEAYYTSAKLDGVREITPCRLWRCGQEEWKNQVILGLLLTYTDGHQSCVGEVRLDQLGTPKIVTSDTMWIEYLEEKDVDPEDTNSYCYPAGIRWFGFSKPLLCPSFSNQGKEKTPDAQVSYGGGLDDSEEKSRPTRFLSVPLRGRLDWEKVHCLPMCLLSHHERSTPDDEMHEVRAKDAALDLKRPDPIERPFSLWYGREPTGNFKKRCEQDEERGTYDIFGI